MDIEPEQDQMRAWRAFLRTHSAVIKALERELQEEQGLPLTWYDIMVHLSEAPGNRLRHQELAESVLLSRSGVTRLVDRMVTAGLVRRESSPEDRRASYVVMTDQGRRKLEAAAPVHLRGIVEHFTRHLNGGDAESLGSVFHRVLEAEAGPKA